MKKFLIAVLLVFLTGMASYSQNFNRLTQIIETEEITNGQIAYFVGTYLDQISEKQTDGQCFDKLKGEGFFASSANSESAILLKDLCSLFAKATDAKGGMMFSLTNKSGRYAFKEFKAKGLLPKNADPLMTVSGTNAINLFNSLIGETK